MKTAIQVSLFVLLALASSGHAQGTAFTYQGRLNVNGEPATGNYDMMFVLCDAANGPNLLATTALTSLSVTGGLFIATLDFGAAAFDGGARWLEIGVRTNGSVAGFAALTPRQPLTPSPYAHFAYTAATVTNGSITGAKLAPNAVTPAALRTPAAPAVGQVLTYNGTSLDWRSPGSTSWSLTGNAGTSAGANFLGTLEAQPLELRVNGTRALRLEPDAASPNVIGGASVNYANGARGATIGGGGTLNFGGFVYSNAVSGFYGTVSGGLGNSAGSLASGIGGGFNNIVEGMAPYSVIAGGSGNTIQTSSHSSGIGAGAGNAIVTNASYSTIAGGKGNTIGWGNTILFGADYASIGGGNENTIDSDAPNSTIAGGQQNAILAFARHSAIGGGYFNSIQRSESSAISGGWGNSVDAADYSFIGGGQQNRMGGNALGGTVAGGSGNAIYSQYASIGGGLDNRIEINSSYSTIGGGWSNTNAAASGTIAGGYQNNNYSANASIGGGYFNTIWTNSPDSTIGGGRANTIANDAFGSTIGGGFGHFISSYANSSTVSGGATNLINAFASESAIGGGAYNSIGIFSYDSTISGGTANTVERDTPYSTISGGQGNSIQFQAGMSTIGGGQYNSIQTNAWHSTIGGGASNTNAGDYATVPGGQLNHAGGNFSFAAGRRARANYSGDFVWADSTSADFNSSGPDQFLVRASSGVGINTNDPSGHALSVAGSTRVTGVLRSGSEAGTTQPPSPAGLVVRRINSTSASANQVVARTDLLTLERDGSNGGFLIRYPAPPGNTTIACMGMNSAGSQVNFYTALSNPGGAGTVQIYTDGQAIVHFQCTFGKTYDANQHLTQVTLSRYGTDNYWSGTVTSTYNQ